MYQNLFASDKDLFLTQLFTLLTDWDLRTKLKNAQFLVVLTEIARTETASRSYSDFIFDFIPISQVGEEGCPSTRHEN